MRKVSIEEVVDLMVNDIYVNVDIQIKPLTFSDDPKRKIVLDRTNADLGALGFQIQCDIKKQIKEFFGEKVEE